MQSIQAHRTRHVMDKRVIADLIKLNHGREGDGGQSWLNFSAITSHIASVSIIYTASSKRQLHRNCLKVAMFRRAAKCSPTYRAAVCLGTVTPKDILLIATSRYLAFVYHNTEGKAILQRLQCVSIERS